MAILKRELASHTDIINNKNRRIPICICIDVSSKANKNHRFLNELINKICSEPSMKAAVDLFIMAYAEEPQVVREFSNLTDSTKDLELPILEGEPRMFSSLDLCLRKLQQRLNEYRNVSLSRHHPIVVIISSGYTTESPDNYAKKQENWRNLETSRILSVVPIMNGTGNSEILRGMTNDNKIAIAEGNNLSKLLDEISNSVQALSKSTSDAYRNLKENMSSWT